MNHVDADTYIAVQRFYAELMHALDERRFEEFAGMFTDDGVFAHTAGRVPARAPAGILRELREFHTDPKYAEVRRRHWFGHLLVHRIDADTFETQVYVLVVGVRAGAAPTIFFSGTATDTLVRTGESFSIRSRRAVNDGIRAARV